jgi:hypothetical protein
MKKVFVFNGCSNTAGREVLKDFPEATDFETRDHTWAKHLQNQMNPDGEFVNLGRSGASNESIFRETLSWLSRNQDKRQDTFVAIMWTEPNRFEFEFLNGDKSDIIAASSHFRRPEEKYLNSFANEYLSNKELTRIKNLNLMLSLEAILNQYEVQHIFLNGFPMKHFYHGHWVQFTDYVKLSKYPGKAQLMSDELCMLTVLEREGFTPTKHLHFYEEAHKYYANYIFNKLGELL